MIEQQWRDLEAELPFAGWRLRLACPQKAFPLYVALDGTTQRRALLLRAAAEVVPPRRRWPSCRGLLLFVETVNSQPHCGVALKEPRFLDVFSALAEDLARRVAASETPAEAVATLLGQLARWQKFLATSVDGLGEEGQRGLWGELHCLREHLIPAFGASVAVAGWKGGERAQQDFQFARGALEVKTTTAKQPQAVRITSERQLDDTPWPALFLHVLVLEIRDGSSATLPMLVESLRAVLQADPTARERFEDTLIAAGYFDVHAQRYTGRGYTVRAAHWFRVRGNFPRLIESQLPPGVGDAHYALSLAACERYSVEPARVLTTLAKTSRQAKP